MPSVGNICYPSSLPPTGTIVFNGDFECGNLGRVDVITQDEYDLFIRPDTCNNKYRVWFYFECKNAQQGQRIVFNIVNFSKTRTLFENGFASPVYLPNGQLNWSRLPSKDTFYYQSPHHGDRFILSFIHIFESDAPVKFAYSIPYTYSELEKWIVDIEKRNLPFFESSLLCQSIQKRSVKVLTIGGDPWRQLPLVVLTGRVHPGESPSSFVIQGFVEFLLSSDPRAERLRSFYVFKVIPMLNPDGVVLGNYRSSFGGVDLNRQWRYPHEQFHPTIFAARRLFMDLSSNPLCPVEMYFDVHAHSQKTNSFLYGNVNYDDRQLWLPQLLTEIADDFSLASTEFNTDVDKEGTGRRSVGELLDSSLCYTLEVSFFSYIQNNSSSLVVLPYLQYKYESLGEALTLAILRKKELELERKPITITREYRTFVAEKRSFKEKAGLVKAASRATKHSI